MVGAGLFRRRKKQSLKEEAVIEAVIAANFKHIYLLFLDDGKDKTKTTKFAINTVR
jgi:hypothetical protein